MTIHSTHNMKGLANTFDVRLISKRFKIKKIRFTHYIFVTIFSVWVTCMGFKLHITRHLMITQNIHKFNGKFSFHNHLISLLGYYQILWTRNYLMAQPTCATSIIFLPFQVGDPKKYSCSTHEAFLPRINCEPLVPWFGKAKFFHIVFLLLG